MYYEYLVYDWDEYRIENRHHNLIVFLKSVKSQASAAVQLSEHKILLIQMSKFRLKKQRKPLLAFHLFKG